MGKPLIAWTIEAALKADGLDQVVVSTDDKEISQVSQQWGAEVPFMRPPELAQDGSDHISVAEHAIRWLEKNRTHGFDYVMLLQPTSPLRTTSDIDAAIRIAMEHDAAAVVSVSEMKQHPYLSRRISEDGTIAEFMSSDIGYLSRQSLPPAYAINGAIYLNRPESILRDRTFFPSGTYPYVMPPERSVDIDTAWDVQLAELILKNEMNGESSRDRRP